jgi:hypothetical protein
MVKLYGVQEEATVLWFAGTLWPSLAICAVLYILDYYLTITGARLYRNGAQRLITFEGSYELNPRFQHDVDQLRWVSRRFAWAMIRLLAIMSLIWWAAIKIGIPQIFSLYLGLFVGLQLAVQKRHLQNILLFRAITKPGAVQGQIKYSRCFMLRQSAVGMLLFAMIFGLLSFLLWNLFLLGGAIGCLSVAIRHLILAKKSAQSTPIRLAAAREGNQ